MFEAHFWIKMEKNFSRMEELLYMAPIMDVSMLLVVLEFYRGMEATQIFSIIIIVSLNSARCRERY